METETKPLCFKNHSADVFKGGIHRRKSKEQKHSGNTEDFHGEPKAQGLAGLFQSEPPPLCPLTA